MINKFINDTAKTKKSTKEDYMFYSRELQEPFESLDALKEAEEAHFAKLKAKEDKAATKKADALKVEDAFMFFIIRPFKLAFPNKSLIL